jgi:hypothetical protein
MALITIAPVIYARERWEAPMWKSARDTAAPVRLSDLKASVSCSFPRLRKTRQPWLRPVKQ